MIIECEFSPLELDAIQTALKQSAEREGQEWFLEIRKYVMHQTVYGRVKKEPPTTMVTATVGSTEHAGSGGIIHTQGGIVNAALCCDGNRQP